MVTFKVVSLAINCHQCSWDGVTERWEKDEEQLKEQLEEMEEMEEVDNPFTLPFFGKNKIPEVPNQHILYRECQNCTMLGGICVRWAFLSAGIPLNVTWMCARSKEKGQCFEQDLSAGLSKEVCLCDEDFCNASRRITDSTLLCLFFAVLNHVLQIT
ncbi:uncharacterized protein LOC143235192 isoform X2 [Tachypleus tridentatus]|uniref:uncharacterized protein LOC143235192 isoform X2 n=1 Tax=Tachypleus tridentatus TaxID=6853 RepID=UPI003FCEF53F